MTIEKRKLGCPTRVDHKATEIPDLTFKAQLTPNPADDFLIEQFDKRFKCTLRNLPLPASYFQAGSH